ncbi:hypothetical protein ALON55S_04742 [Alishewanella longhuensis]
MLQQWQQQQGSYGKALPARQQSITNLGPVWLESRSDEQSDHALVIYLAAQEKSPEQMACFMLANHVHVATVFPPTKNRATTRLSGRAPVMSLSIRYPV